MIKGLVSIIILSYNQLDYTKYCLESIKKYTEDVNYEIIIIDNGSSKETIEYLKQCNDINLILNNENKGFAGGCNQGILLAKGEFILLLNNDTIVTPKWLYNMLNALNCNPHLDMVGPLTNATVGKQMIAVPYENNLEEMQKFALSISEKIEDTLWITLRLVAFCVLIKKTVIDEIGMLDEAFKVGNYEDDDFNIRALLANKNMAICTNSFIHHFMNISFQTKDFKRKQIMYRNKLILEKKWNQMDWNHHADYNRCMLNTIMEHKPKKVCHFGCGVGALAIELKHWNKDCHVVGVEYHDYRFKIASRFFDQCITLTNTEKIFLQLENNCFDVIIIESTLERFGMEFLNKIKQYANSSTLFIIRVFNFHHVTTMEKMVSNQVEGNLLCASSDEFSYYFGGDVKNTLKEFGFCVEKEEKVKKTLSEFQMKLLNKMNEDSNIYKEAIIYNRIYLTKLGENNE